MLIPHTSTFSCRASCAEPRRQPLLLKLCQTVWIRRLSLVRMITRLSFVSALISFAWSPLEWSLRTSFKSFCKSSEPLLILLSMTSSSIWRLCVAMSSLCWSDGKQSWLHNLCIVLQLFSSWQNIKEKVALPHRLQVPVSKLCSDQDR